MPKDPPDMQNRCKMRHFGFASTSLSHVSEMPQRCRPNAVWFTLVGCGWPKSKSSKSCRPLTSSFADGEQGCFGCQSLCLCPRTQLKDKIGKKKLTIWKQLETAIFAARCWTAKRRFGTWLLLLLPDTLATAAWWEFSLSQQNLPPAPVAQGVRSEWTGIYAHYPQVMCTLCMASRCLKYMESQTCYNLNLLEPLLRQAWAICFGKRKTPPPCRWCHPQLDLACQIHRLCKRLAGCAKWKTLNNFE